MARKGFGHRLRGSVRDGLAWWRACDKGGASRERGSVMEGMKASADGVSSDSGADTFGAGAGFPLAGDDPCDAGVDLQASRAEGRAGHGDLMGRRQFVAGAALAGFAVAGSLVATGCSAGKDAQQAPSDQQPIDGEGGPAAEGGAGGAGAPAVSGDASGHKPLPAPEADPESPFGVDAKTWPTATCACSSTLPTTPSSAVTPT